MIDWNQQPLGQMADTKLALMLDVTPQAVAYQRRRREIPALYPPGGTAKKGSGNKAKRRETRRLAQVKRREAIRNSGIPERTEAQRRRRIERQRERRAQIKQTINTRLFNIGVFSEEDY